MSNDPRKFKTGIAVTGTATVGADIITTNTASQTLVNKTIDAASNTISNLADANIASAAAIDASKIANGLVSNAEFQYLDGVTSAIQTQLNAKALASDLSNYILLTEKGANNGVATLDAGGKVPVSQLPNSVMEYQGNWDASTNTPSLADGTGNAGDVYRVNVAGTQDLGSGSQTFAIGDWVVYNGTIWEKSINSNAVVSVNGQSGIVTLTTTDISEGTNLYFTDERAQDAVGNILTDSSKIDFTYNDAGNTITATIVAGSLVNADINASAAIDASKIANGSVSNAEFQYLDGVTSSIQTQLNARSSSGASGAIQLSDGTGGFSSDDTQFLFTGGQFVVGSNVPVSSAIATFANGNGVNTAFNNSLSGASEVIVSVDDVASGVGTTTATDMQVFANLGTGAFLSLGATGGISLNTAGGDIDAGTNKIVNVVDPVSPQDAATKAYVDAAVAGSTGDIPQTTFAASNNVASPANVTGLAFANASVRSFKALVSVRISATSSLYEAFELLGVQRGADWSMSISSTGDDSQVNFSITNAGQVQYTSANLAGFTANSIHFRAIVTNV